MSKWWILVTALTMFFGAVLISYAYDIDIERLADCIYKAENSTTYPYGIMVKYKHTTPRQACINTIKHALRDWNGKGDFIAFLGSRYAPIGANNDPKGLNKNWVKNVKNLYERRR